MGEKNTDVKTDDAETESKPPVASFEEMGLRSELIRGLQDLGYSNPSRHQAQAVPACMASKDVVLIDVAGSGKTVATVISLLNNLDLSLNQCQFLHITPYRECSKWTLQVYQKIGSHLDFTAHACIGGTRVREDIEVLKSGVQIVVSTPGRMLDMLRRQALDTSSLRAVVVDEIHDIVDYKGMEQPTQDLFKELKHRVQVVCVASSISDETQSVINRITTQPVYICTYNFK